jgi:protein BNI4
MASVQLTDLGDEKTGIAMTNSPSFSALASILEKKEASVGTKTSAIEPKTKDKVLSPNLIEFDNEAPQSNTTVTQVIPSTSDDIFKTPEVQQAQTFPTQDYRSLLETYEKKHEKSPNVQVFDTRKEDSATIPTFTQQQVTATKPKAFMSKNASLTNLSSPAPQSSDSPQQLNKKASHSNFKPQPLPKKSPKIAQNYSQRSSSMPVVAAQKEKKSDKRRSFISFFKTKRSVSTSDSVPQVKQEPPKQMSGSQSFHNNKEIPQPRVAHRSSSSTSLFSAFKRSKKVGTIQEETTRDDTFSISSGEGFNEDFNKLKIQETTSQTPQMLQTPTVIVEEAEQKRHSQISQGETLFPKKLSAQDVESIVSLERNRSQSRHSIVSRHQSQNSNRPMSLVEAISSNARVEGMYVEQNIPRQPSMQSISTSIQQSPRQLNYLPEGLDAGVDGELFDVEEFSRSLEFDNIADSYGSDNEVSEFMEFADFIDFGGELDLSFDMEGQGPPLSQPPLNTGSTTSTPQQHNFQSPVSLKSPKFDFDNSSEKNSPQLRDSAFIPSMARPISMSFRGLKAPALQTFHQSDSNTSINSSTVAPSLNASDIHVVQKVNKRVVFSSKITLFDVFTEEEYDRRPDIATCNQLTPQLAQQIRAELNELKGEMEVHESSRCYTHFF